MVKTRAQRGQGITTPQDCNNKTKKEPSSGTDGKKLSAKQIFLAETPEAGHGQVINIRKSKTSSRSSKPKGSSKQRKNDAVQEEVGEEDLSDEVATERSKICMKSRKKDTRSVAHDQDEHISDDVSDGDEEVDREDEEEEEKTERKTAIEDEEMDETADIMERNQGLASEITLAQRSSHGGTERLDDSEDGTDDDNEDDHDAPEDVSFSSSRQQALESISQALEQSKRSGERTKEKRRNRDKLLKLQKERKKISLQRSRLPVDFLSEVAKIPAQKKMENFTVAPTVKPGAKSDGHHRVFDAEDEMDVDGEDYIPFSPEEPPVVDGFEVHAISRQQRAPPPKSDSALDFLQKQLYGTKIKRESVNKHMSRTLKRRGQPGLIFLNPKEKRRKKKHRGTTKATQPDQ